MQVRHRANHCYLAEKREALGTLYKLLEQRVPRNALAMKGKWATRVP